VIEYRKQQKSCYPANVFNLHVHDVCSKFALCSLHRVNRVVSSHNSLLGNTATIRLEISH